MATAALAAKPQPHFGMSTSSKRPVPHPRTSTSNLATRPTKASCNRRGSSVSSSAPSPLPSTASIVVASNSKDTSSSAGKVFAKPSKEWVLPERAKPGRKVSLEEPDSKRQSQNRLSQRAHRARKTDYIQTLEERLRQYEADEIHSNVRLQEVARALKADNERLKKETAALRLEISELQAQRRGWDLDRANYEGLVARMSTELKTLRGDEGSSPQFVSLQHRRTSIHSTPKLVPSSINDTNRRAALDCPICPNPDPDCPCQQGDAAGSLPAIRPTAPLAALHLAVKAIAEQDPPKSDDPSCGVCQTDDECLCRVIKEEDDGPAPFPSPSPEVGFGGSVPDGCGLCTSATFCACKATTTTSSQSPAAGVSTRATVTTITSSVAAVPLRLGRSRPKAASIWSLDPPSSKSKEAECSGDPSNCDACRNDSFGKEFCENLFEKTAKEPVAKPCPKCPGDCMSIESLLCAPDQDGDTPPPARESRVGEITPISSRPGVAIDQNGDTMTCDQAWKALKAHPNSRFASLSLLADVVAGRTVCTGPRDSPVPFQPAASASPADQNGYKPSSQGTNPSKQRNMAVETSAVRDALRLLDNTAQAPVAAAEIGNGPDAKRRRIDL